MEKLIELFNEYERPQTNHIYTAYEVKENMNRLDILQEFIKWLVDNDKINKKKIDTRLVKYVESYYDEDWYWMENSYEDYSHTNTLLMILAISDTPIKDLISYLK